jgi:hypothetical protein
LARLDTEVQIIMSNVLLGRNRLVCVLAATIALAAAFAAPSLTGLVQSQGTSATGSQSLDLAYGKPGQGDPYRRG